MKRKSIILKILLFSLILNSTIPVFSEDTTPLEYDSSSMPQGLKDLRRFEIITLGSLPFVTLDAGIVYSGMKDTVVLNPEDFESEEEFNKWKEWKVLF